ncbi:MAG: hypothetical protein Ct9H90mP18_06110 [Gammaproteobacteria bacterium]|nr:MAG: hypothetical protein Ct9H90mP18_06110 [Gammaproteobacteria bacterium]
MFPYQVENYTLGMFEIILSASHFKISKNDWEECFQPMGWDSFGLPAENAAKKKKYRQQSGLK